MAQELVELPHNKKVIGLIPGFRDFNVVFACSPYACIGSSRVLQHVCEAIAACNKWQVGVNVTAFVVCV